MKRRGDDQALSGVGGESAHVAKNSSLAPGYDWKARRCRPRHTTTWHARALSLRAPSR